jgi:hypothetical protein
VGRPTTERSGDASPSRADRGPSQAGAAPRQGDRPREPSQGAARGGSAFATGRLSDVHHAYKDPRAARAALGRVRPAWAAAWGCESPVEEMTPTTSQRQLRHREVGWEGSPRRIRDPRYTNRVQGGAVWTSRHDTAKPVVIKGPLRRRGGCAGKVAALIRGGLHGCPVWDGGGREAAARRGEVSRGRSTGGGSAGCREGPNAEPRRRSFVLAGVALIAANPVRGLGGKAEG